MPKLKVTWTDGSQATLEGAAGLSVMEVIRNSGSDDLLALCGGARSCATCQVYVDPAFWSRLPAPEPEELELLDLAEGRQDNSRLSCQIVFTDALDGLAVTVAPVEE